jgi:hypothetical protein
MVNHARLNISSVLLLAVFLIAVIGCSGSDDPRDVEFTIAVRDGVAVGGVKSLKVTEGDTVTLRYESDTVGGFHLHGYDIETDVEAGEVGVETFLADASGRFAIEIEETGESLAFLEVLPR